MTTENTPRVTQADREAAMRAALAKIERTYWIEGKDAAWRAAEMRSIAVAELGKAHKPLVSDFEHREHRAEGTALIDPRLPVELSDGTPRKITAWHGTWCETEDGGVFDHMGTSLSGFDWHRTLRNRRPV